MWRSSDNEGMKEAALRDKSSADQHTARLVSTKINHPISKLKYRNGGTFSEANCDWNIGVEVRCSNIFVAQTLALKH
jgi:hypothetical protein